MRTTRIPASRIASIALLGLALTVSAAAAAEPDASETGEATPSRALTNQDLPSLERMDTSKAALPEATPVGTGGPRPIRMADVDTEPASVADRAETEPSIPELLDELARLRKQRMRLQVPFLSRRFVDLRAGEDGAAEHAGRRVRHGEVRERLAEVTQALRERGVQVPGQEFGQPADLFETDLTQDVPVVTDISGGPGVPTERLSETDDAGEGGARVVYGLDELAVPLTAEPLGDGRPKPLFTGDFDDVPVVRPY